MKAQNLLFPLVLLGLLLMVPSYAENIAFKHGEISATVKGTLVADQTKEYIFRGQAGQKFEMQADSQRGEWLLLRVRAKDKTEVFSNFDSEDLKTKGTLPISGDYTVYLGLRRPEVQREGRVDYVLTLTLHPRPEGVAIKQGKGEYFVSDGAGTRPVRGVTVGLGNADEFEVGVGLDGDGFLIKGTWKAQSDEAAVLEITEAFGKKARGRGVILLDDEINDGGEPTYVQLRFDLPEQGTHHDLVFGDR